MSGHDPRGLDRDLRSGDVDARLIAAAASATWPATPPLRDAVLARLPTPLPDLRGPVVERIAGSRPTGTQPAGTQPAGAPGWRLARRPVVRGLALAVLATLALAGVAAALGYRLPGLDVVFVASLPPAGAGLDLGSPVPVADARAAERPAVLLPSALRSPDAAWAAGAGNRRIVTVAWRARPGEPAIAGSDLSVLLMAAAGEADEAFLTKALPPGTHLERVAVGTDVGWWITGAPHELLFRRADGSAGELPSRLAGDTLVFSRDGTLYRFESALGRDATVALALTLR